jgi:hypothetical protein
MIMCVCGTRASHMHLLLIACLQRAHV